MYISTFERAPRDHRVMMTRSKYFVYDIKDSRKAWLKVERGGSDITVVTDRWSDEWWNNDDHPF